MTYWYRKASAKAAVLIAGVLGGAVFAAALVSAATLAGSIHPSDMFSQGIYEESDDFENAVDGSVYEVLRKFRLSAFFETDGAYNPDKVIDIREYGQYMEGAEAVDDNSSGIEYTIGELVDWSREYTAGNSSSYDENNVVVCQRADGSYYYYYLEEFLNLFESGELAASFETEYQNQAGFLQELAGGSLTSSEGYGLTISDRDGNVLYTDCWSYGESLKEQGTPVGAENLLQAVNASEKLNGQLSNIYSDLSYVLSNIYSDYLSYESGWEYLKEGNTNLTYLFVDENTGQVFTNRSEYADYSRAEENIEKMKSGDSVRYLVIYPQLEDYESNMSLTASTEWEMVRSQMGGSQFNGILAVSVDTSYPVQDLFYEGNERYEENVPVLRAAVILTAAGALLFLIALVWLTVTAGRQPEDGESRETHLTVFDRWKTEPAAICVIAVWIAGTWLLWGMGIVSADSLSTTSSYYADQYMSGTNTVYNAAVANSLSVSDTVFVFGYGLFTFLCFFWGYLSLVRRIRAKTVWKGSLTRAVIVFAKDVLRARSVTVRTGVITAGFLAFQFVAILVRNVPMLVLALASDAVVFWYVLSSAMAKERIRKGIVEIASGNLEYRIDLEKLRGTDLEMAERVNDIGSGLNKAMAEAMKGERLKTDLITNVSHDIKTPLTSIINYVDILKRSDIADEKIQGYLDILEAKAQRLKTLTEDVVEASKVSSGNITLEYMDMDLRELVQQSSGELEEKFTARNLKVVLSLPEEPAVIHVDGRRMWRVLENIFGNAAKYAMPGTRVYADLTMNEKNVEFSLKNVSEQQLNISADELTERFIRGDISRSTEGSGLGLSIAKSLTTMQGGEFELYLDGDLFRVNIRFPRVGLR